MWLEIGKMCLIKWIENNKVAKKKNSFTVKKKSLMIEKLNQIWEDISTSWGCSWIYKIKMWKIDKYYHISCKLWALLGHF